MTALKGKAIDAFVGKPDPHVFAVLIYGPDDGLIRERALTIAKSVVDDINDPFNAIEFADSDLKAEPSKLIDEACALSFMGGQRLIRLRTSGDSAFGATKLLVDAIDAGNVTPNALTVIEGGDLAKSSKLRKLFEGAKKSLALPCYADNAQDVRSMAINMGQAEGLTIEPNALDLIVSLLGEDRGVSRAELEKLILYAGPKGSRDSDTPITKITVDDVRACLVDTMGDTANDIAAAAADGDTKNLSLALFRSATAGANAIAVLKVLQREFHRLQAAAIHVQDGSNISEAMKKLRPPVFFMEQKAFERRLRQWRRPNIEKALDILIDAELDAKRTGSPQSEIAERAAFKIAMMARN